MDAEFLLEVIEVHLVACGGAAQRRCDAHAAVLLDEAPEGVVDGGLDEHLVAGAREIVDEESYPLDHTVDIDEVLASHMPAVAGAQPVYNGLPVALGHRRIAVDGVREPAGKGRGYFGGYGKVHVGYP